MKYLLKGKAGFSLVELMVVVGIIGVLAAMAVPKYQVFKAKAQQAEAKTNLQQIHTLQSSYHFDFNIFGLLIDDANNEIGFNVNDALTRYDYTGPAARDAFTFLSTATSEIKLASCSAAVDIWTVDQAKNIVNTQDGIGGCSN